MFIAGNIEEMLNSQTLRVTPGFFNSFANLRSQVDAKADVSHKRWRSICKKYLTITSNNSIWRFSRKTKEGEPEQGWKLHISATVLNACDIFESIAPFLILRDVQFKAPASLNELSKINSGLYYGYQQVGKFITIYPSSKEEAIYLARELHNLTDEFTSPAIPFDRQYLPQSCIFYRYGGFASIEIKNSDGRTSPVIRDQSGNLVLDDRLHAFPEWLSDPFQNNQDNVENYTGIMETPLTTTYKVFRALTQRGKGGTYQALDLSASPPRFCVIKEGRKYGEIGWDGQDGYQLVRNEFAMLSALENSCIDLPQVFSSFEIDGNFYLVMEYVKGKSLHDLLKTRRRRLSIKRVIILAIEIARIIDKIHRAGWIWGDCKPANLIVTRENSLRPLDFEGSYQTDGSNRFAWQTDGFSKPVDDEFSASSGGKADDLYALGAVLYFLLSGKLYEPNTPIMIKKLRRNVPQDLEIVTDKLLCGSNQNTNLTMTEIRKELERILTSAAPTIKDLRTA